MNKINRHEYYFWLLINLSLCVFSTVISSFYNSINLVGDINPYFELGLLLLAVILFWLFTWGVFCSFTNVEYKQGDKLLGMKANLSYATSIICGIAFPYLMVGG